MKKLLLFWLPILCFFFAKSQSTSPSEYSLWYNKPASSILAKNKKDSWQTYINEALPIGNGHIGGLVAGGTNKDTLRLNEISLWTGSDNISGSYEKAGMGAYQSLGDLTLSLPEHENATNYRRDLDISRSLASVSYNCNGVAYHREYFCSNPAGIMAIRFTANKSGAYSGSIGLTDAHNGTVKADGNIITLSGSLSNGLKYEGQVMLVHSGGTASVSNNGISFSNCNNITLYFAAGTDYAMDYSKNYRGANPHELVTDRIEKAKKNGYDALLVNHLKDYKSFFNKASILLGKSTEAQKAMPTDLRRLEAAKTTDPELECLMFQYGRYLIISSSRPGGLPANLQGLWNDSNTPPWSSDYHTNINIQMNYWGVESTNIPECHLPLFQLVNSQLPAWRKATAASSELKTIQGSITSRGWAVRTSHNIMGGMGWKWDKTANAWYCLHFWEHYAFSGDKEFLRKTAYPIMKETTEYWEDHLKNLPDGSLVVPNGWSPEHGPTEDGVSYSQEIVWDLFNNYVEAADVLKSDKTYRDKIASLRDKLVTPGIGSWGQLLEWMTEKKGDKVLDTKDDHHRHTSHLFGVYPGRQIGLTITPQLAEAAKVSLEARGDMGDVREWSYAWRTALYARLRDGEAAHSQFKHLFGTTCPNLFGNHPPMQIDGNLGITGAVSEMLLQSHESEISLLPAIPKEWSSGSVKGLKARGGFIVDITWENGKVTTYRIASSTPKSIKLRINGELKQVVSTRLKD